MHFYTQSEIEVNGRKFGQRFGAEKSEPHQLGGQGERTCNSTGIQVANAFC